MKSTKLRSNSILAIIPVLIWNLAFYSYLPDSYKADGSWGDFPMFLEVVETVLRIAVFAIPVFFYIEVKNKLQKIGLSMYLFGLIVYMISWLLQIANPESAWSTTAIGFSAPAFTSFIWLIGLGLMSKNYNSKLSILQSIYYISVTLFVLVHTFHAMLAFYGVADH